MHNVEPFGYIKMEKKRFKVILQHSYSIVEFTKANAISIAKDSLKDTIRNCLLLEGSSSSKEVNNIIDTFGILVKEEQLNNNIVAKPDLQSDIDTLLEPDRKKEKVKQFVEEYNKLVQKYDLGIVASSDEIGSIVATIDNKELYIKYLENNLFLSKIKL